MSNLAVIEEQSAVPGALQITTVEDLHRVSTMLSKSGFFSDARDAAQCGVKVLAGLEMGFGAFASMTGIHIIKGKPSIGASLMAAAVKRHPNYNYRVLEHTEQVCKVEFYERWDGKLQSVGTSEFTVADAKKAGTQNLDKYPRNMLFARAMSNGVKWYCPDVFDAPVYTPDELGSEVDGEGNYIPPSPTDVPIEPTPSFAAQAKEIADYGKYNGLTSEKLIALCKSENLPSSPSGFKTKAQVNTFSALVEDAIAAQPFRESAGPDYEGDVVYAAG